MVASSKIPIPQLQSSFHYDVDVLVISYCFMLYPSCPSIVGEPLVSARCDSPLLEPYISLSSVM